MVQNQMATRVYGAMVGSRPLGRPLLTPKWTPQPTVKHPALLEHPCHGMWVGNPVNSVIPPDIPNHHTSEDHQRSPDASQIRAASTPQAEPFEDARAGDTPNASAFEGTAPVAGKGPYVFLVG